MTEQNRELIEKCLPKDKELRKLAHEYFKIGNHKSSLRAGHWIDFVKHQILNALTEAIPIIRQAAEKEATLQAALTVRDAVNDSIKKERQNTAEDIKARLEEYLLQGSYAQLVLSESWQAFWQDVIRGK